MTDHAEQSGQAIEVGELWSYAVDVHVRDGAVLTDEPALRALLRSAAEAGNARVLGESAHVFGNGAVTLVLLLSQSHLSVHTWPEFGLANFDLLAYGKLHAETILDRIRKAWEPAEFNVTRLLRASG